MQWHWKTGDAFDYEFLCLICQHRTGIDESYEFRRASNRNAPRVRAAPLRSLSGGLPEIFPVTGDLETGSNDVPQPVSPLAGSKAAGGDGTEMIVPLSSPLPGLPTVMHGWPLVRGMRTHCLDIAILVVVSLDLNCKIDLIC